MLALCNKRGGRARDRRRLDGRGAGRHGRRSSTARARSACGSAAARPTIGIFAQQWHGHADEVIVVDDHITGVLTEHQAGRFLDMKPAGIRVRGRKSTPGRYFQVAEPGPRLGRHRHHRSARDHREDRSQAGLARPAAADGLDHRRAFGVVRARRGPEAAAGRRCRRRSRQVVERIAENCEPALCTVLFMAGAGGSLRAGVTENPVRLTRSVRDALTTRHLRRRAGLCLAGRRHHLDGRCRADAGEVVRLRADAGAGGADRVHPARRGLCGAGRLRPSRAVDARRACVRRGRQAVAGCDRGRAE